MDRRHGILKVHVHTQNLSLMFLDVAYVSRHGCTVMLFGIQFNVLHVLFLICRSFVQLECRLMLWTYCVGFSSMNQQECASISYAKTHLTSFKIIDGFQHPRATPKVGDVNICPSVGSFHTKFLPNKDAIDTHDVTSLMKAKGKEATNSNKKREKREPRAKLLVAKKALLKGPSTTTNQ